ncbi:neutral zinc metallopeptidase [Comamonas testosteroni]|uniref:ImmA/IrrE family metallo-endopeptidase n=1 Tax=Comamonas testosteroni TaxID=285 RepID=UPI0023AAEC1F|nr:neutral zinc metallopeptidase [Comamonas testosteroni]WEE75704.1 neutral zinc metallopeptidase [Comamonas testosteroni]
MTTIVKDGVIRVPSGLKVKAASYLSIETLADSVRGNLPTLRGERYCLDALTIFERTFPQLGYHYRTAEIDEIDECAAFTITAPDCNLVVMREDIYDKLHAGNPFGRSTVIHELSHVAQNHAITLHRGATLTQHAFFEDSEWQAKACTAALMMPLAACQVAKSPSDLAAMCGTSVESATYRIKTLVKKLKTLAPNYPLWEFGYEG